MENNKSSDMFSFEETKEYEDNKLSKQFTTTNSSSRNIVNDSEYIDFLTPNTPVQSSLLNTTENMSRATHTGKNDQSNSNLLIFDENELEENFTRSTYKSHDIYPDLLTSSSSAPKVLDESTEKLNISLDVKEELDDSTDEDSTEGFTETEEYKAPTTMYYFRASWRDPTAVITKEKPLKVLSNQDEFILRLRGREESLVIEKKKGHPGSMNEVSTTNLSYKTSLREYDAYGVLGIIALQSQSKEVESYLVLISAVSLVGKITGIPIYKITQVEFIPFNPNVEFLKSNAKKPPYESLKRFCESGLFYFSLDYDLTHSQQRLHTKRERFETINACRAADRRFFWNRYLARYFIRKKLDHYISIVIRGNVSIAENQYINSKSTCDLIIISRIGCLRAGTRYGARGVNDNGDVGNFVETEQILVSPDNLSSYVIVRGSVPVFWEEPMTSTGHIPKLSRSAETTTVAFQKHFHYLNYHYGNVHIINLLSKKKKEAVVVEAFEDQLERWKDSTSECITYTYFDFHSECSGEKYEGLKKLLHEISSDYARHNFFIFNKKTYRILGIQKGIFRINCLDCLDRTNFTQSAICRIILRGQLKTLYPQNSVVSHGSKLSSVFNSFWADNGDALSHAYTGTGALNSFYTRKGKSSIAGLLDDGMKSIARFYINTFKDEDNQLCIDLFLGKIEEYTEEDISVEDGWIRAQLRKREAEFTTHVTKKIYIGTFNCNASSPQSDSIEKWLDCDIEFNDINIFVFGFQEIVALNASQVWNADSTNCRLWDAKILKFLNSKRKKVIQLKSLQLVGIYLSIFVSEDELHRFKNVNESVSKVGFKGMSGNKGAVCLSFTYDDTSMCFICAHLSAGQRNFNRRVSDYTLISQKTQFGTSKQLSKKISDHDMVFWLGDFNWRIDLTYEQTLNCILKGKIRDLYPHDQLRRAQKDLLAFQGFNEAPITFKPTYKFDVGTKIYDTSEKRRIPAWTDRILYRSFSEQSIECLMYDSSNLLISDHLPVNSLFNISIKCVDEKKKKIIEEELCEKIKEYDINTLEQQNDNPVL